LKRSLLVGALAWIALALPVILALRPAPAAPPAWPTTPSQPPLPAPDAPARWDAPAGESLARLRRTTVAETRRADSELAACEARATRSARPNRSYRRCATPLLARANGFATANGRMLSELASAAGPTETCRGRVLRLSGSAGSLAFLADATLRGGLDAPWAELLDASRTVRALAREARRLADEPGWSATCRARPKAKPPAAPVL